MKACQKIIEELESIDPSSEYAYEAAISCYFIFRRLPIVSYQIPVGTPLFRARPHSENVFYQQISEIGSPPPLKVLNYARCNKPFQSVFYCSSNRPTSFHELIEYWLESTKYDETIYVTIGRWELKKPLNAIIIADPGLEYSDFDTYHGTGINEAIDKHAGDEKEKYVMFFQFLTSRFRKPAKNDLQTYLITSSYCNLALLHAKGRANAIHYPSVPFKGQGLNYCINREFMMDKSNIELTHVIRDEFICYENENSKPTYFERNLIECKTIDLKNNFIIW